jgi:anti-sigma factor RsiW
MNCDKITQMHRLHDGEISPAGRPALEAHAASCSECRRLLADLRGITRLISEAPSNPMPHGMIDRVATCVPRSEDRAIMRIASGLTAAAAAILLAVVLTWPADGTDGSGQPAIWQSLAVTPSVENYGSDTEMLVLAQWMADDLASTHNGELR